MFSPTSIAGKFARGVLGPDQAVQKGWVEPRSAASRRKTAAAARAHLAQASANTSNELRLERLGKLQGKTSTPASKAASIKPSGVEPQPLVVSDVKLEDSQSSRSSRVGTRLCQLASSVGNPLFRVLSFSALARVAHAAAARCNELFTRDGVVRFDSTSNICTREGLPNAPGDVLRSMETYQGVPEHFWFEDAFGSGSGWFPTVIASVCEAVGNSSALNPATWNPAQWVQSGGVSVDKAQECAWALCHLLINGSDVSAGAVGYNGTSLDGRYYGCGLEFINASSPVNGSSSSDSVDVPVDYTPVIMYGTALLVGLITNVYWSSKARQDVVNVIRSIDNHHETQNFLNAVGSEVKAFGEGQVPQGVSLVLGNALGVGVAMLANHLSSAPIDWEDKPWETEAFKNMVVFVGAQVIAEGLSLFTDKCGLGYSGGTMAGKPNQRQLQDKLDSFLERTTSVLTYDDQFYKDEGTINRVGNLRQHNDDSNLILMADGGKYEHISRVVKAMGPEIVSLAGLVFLLQNTNNDWVEKAVGGGALYVFGSAAVNAMALKCAGSSGSVRSSMSLQAMKIMKGILNTHDVTVEMGQV